MPRGILMTGQSHGQSRVHCRFGSSCFDQHYLNSAIMPQFLQCIRAEILCPYCDTMCEDYMVLWVFSHDAEWDTWFWKADSIFYHHDDNWCMAKIPT